MWRSVEDIEDFDGEEESGVCLDDLTTSFAAIGDVGGTDKLCHRAFLQADEAHIPALDHATGSNSELKGLASIVAGVELGTVEHSATVVSLDLLGLANRFTFTFSEHGDGEGRSVRSVGGRGICLDCLRFVCRLDIDDFDAE